MTCLGSTGWLTPPLGKEEQFQKTLWDVICKYTHTDIYCTCLSPFEHQLISQIFYIFYKINDILFVKINIFIYFELVSFQRPFQMLLPSWSFLIRSLLEYELSVFGVFFVTNKILILKLYMMFLKFPILEFKLLGGKNYILLSLCKRYKIYSSIILIT